MSKYVKNPGELDPDFGIEGYANLPFPPGSLSSGTVHSTTTDSAHRIAWAGGVTINGEEFDFFARMDAKGVWESDPGFVAIEDPGLDEQAFQFITPARPESDSNYIAQALRVTWNGDDWLWHAAVGHYQNNFAALAGFGTKGMITIKPGSQRNAKATTTTKPEQRPTVKPVNKSKAPEHLENRYKDRVFAPAARSVLLGNNIKTLYASSLEFQPNSQRLWVALHDAKTGAPVPGLGPDGTHSQWLIPNFLGDTFKPWGCHFFEDGGFALAGKEGVSGIVARYKSNGLLDTDFNQNGYIQLDDCNIHLGADESRIIIAQGTYFTSEPGRPINLTIRAYHKQTGLPDTQFNEDGVLSVDIDPGTDIRALATESIILASDGAVYIAGNLMHVDGSSFYDQGIIFKVTRDGKLDGNFASEGCYRVPTDKLNTLRAAHLGSDGLRFISELNEGGRCAMKLFI
ncbi:hypothetical protein HG549_13520 [Pseudomonas sp. SK]|uniref:hypothetical protein n=1 Tax=Pseudomonas sp. SK TaxID=2729423 RepID=UPI0014636A0A|nr:hypothetical protein [Pseudomonas sp. SK]QJQ20899.1 hypothetical protein HG549_13520 [Pseudomonas sp. SK]